MCDIMTTDNSKYSENEREALALNLCEFAVKGLVRMFNHKKNVFCYRIRNTEEGIVCDGESFRYTIISLLGLKRYEQHFGSSPISIIEVYNEILRNIKTIKYAGDAGLILWLTAMVAPERLGEVFSQLNIINTWRSCPDADKGMTTELSWLLTGLCYAMLKVDQPSPGIIDNAIEVFKQIKINYGEKGIFGHQHGKSIAGAIRGNIGCFADQVYPIYALTRFAETHGNSEALTMAKQCSETICDLQGRYGQWWWHYDSKKGIIAGRYPVFSVHQYGMAPMALFAAAEKTGIDYGASIYKGLNWILGKNELGKDMRDIAQSLIWRNFHQKRWKQNRELLSSMIGFRTNENALANLEILYECRPYSLGWLLYAFADKAGKIT